MSMDRCYDMVEQVLFDILLYLPVLSLLRFKAVCKYWFSLIESSAFISEHLNHNHYNTEDNFIILSRGFGKEFKEEICKRRFALLSGREYEECVYDIDIGQFWHPPNCVILTGYCDGIVCLNHGKTFEEITLWNPALNQVRSLPPPLYSDRLISEEINLCSPTRISFGIDVKSNDYKLVRIAIFDKECKNQVEVYNLGGDNSWRIIHKDHVLPFVEIDTKTAISSSKIGKCFWIASYHDLFLDTFRKIQILLSFDFNDDTFRTMLLPIDERYGHFDLDLLDDKVVFIKERCTLDCVLSIEIWMLHEFGVEKSWSLMYKIEPLSYLNIFYPRLFSKNGEFLICGKSVEGKDIFYLYNLHTQQGKYRQKCNLDFRFGRIIRYNASLLSLKSVNDVKPTE